MAGNDKFRYDMLLRVRTLQQDIKAQVLGETRRAVQATEQERDDILAMRQQTLEDAAQKAARHIDVRDVYRYYAYERHLARLAVEKDAQLAMLRKQEEAHRLELEEAMKRKKVVERLKDRHDERAQSEQKKSEQRFSDEVANSREARKRVEKRNNA